MKNRASEPADDDILLPDAAAGHDTADGAKTSGATRAAGAHLRMPPLIEHGAKWSENWAGAMREGFGDWFTLPPSAWLGRAQSGVLQFVRRTAYHLTLWTLVLATLFITGFGIWQARHIEMPDFDNFWFNPDRVEQDRLTRQGGDTKDILSGPLTAADTTAPDTRPMIDSPDGTGTNRIAANGTDNHGDAKNADAPQASNDALPHNASDDLTAALTASLAAERQALADSRARLAAAEAQIVALSESRAQNRSADKAAMTLLAQRFAMADLLLRLDAGVSYDDILADGRLRPVLTRREWALLALHGSVGIPTRPALALQFDAWTALLAPTKGNSAYHGLMSWLAQNAGSLISVSEMPMSLPGDVLNDIAAALSAGRLDAAALDMGRILRRLEADATSDQAHISGLQAVYDDTRAAAELAPLLDALKRDYMSGARP